MDKPYQVFMNLMNFNHVIPRVKTSCKEFFVGGPKILARDFKSKTSWISWNYRNHKAKPLGLLILVLISSV